MSAMYLNDSRKMPGAQVSWVSDLMNDPRDLSFDYLDNEYLLNGIEGIPYQFLPNVDRRIDGSDKLDQTGRKYSEKIISQMPILFLMPCKPKFLPDADSTTSHNILSDLVTGAGETLSFVEQGSRYYSAEFAYNDYYSYLNTMLSSVLHYMSIMKNGEKMRLSDLQVNFQDGQGTKKLGERNWRDQSNSFKDYFTESNMLAFYVDGLNSIDNSFSNSTTASSLASQVNGYSDQVNELRFLFGKQTGSKLGAMAEDSINFTGAMAEAVSGLGLGTLGGGIIDSLLKSSTADMVLQGGKISFPEIWSNSEYSEAYSFTLKLRSPDNDPLSIFMNVIKPYCEMLCLTLPHNIGTSNDYNPNAYISPFLVKGFCKSLFSIDLGIISGLQATRGAECQWSDDGLPTQIDLTFEITNLYSQLTMPSYDSINDYEHIFSNSYYLDFLANLAGCNVMEEHFIGNKISYVGDLINHQLDNLPSRLFRGVEEGVYRKIGNMFKLT
jgi:hypothetical protein